MLLVFVLFSLARTVGAEAATSKCSIPKPCALVENAGTGPASEADANSGPGVLGTTDSGYYLDPGVEGESQNPDGSDAAGAFGLNFYAGGAPPTYGVLAYGAVDGVYGETESAGSSAGVGVEGLDNGGAANQDMNGGVLGYSGYGTGVIGEANASPSGSTFGSQPIGGYFVGDGNSVTVMSGTTYHFGIGAVVQSNTTPLAAANTTTGDYVDIDGQTLSGIGSNYFFYGSTANGVQYATIDDSGTEVLSGPLTATTVTTRKGTYVRTRSASGRAKIAYGAQTTAPQMEDVGEAQLANGRAHVPIDGALADVIDRHTSYHVFLTPEGDCNGLYVTQKTTNGFEVRELRGGTSSLAFEYRIVARPLGENGGRLAAAPDEKPPAPPNAHRSERRVPRAETPLQRLERILGPIGATRAIRAFETERRDATVR